VKTAYSYVRWSTVSQGESGRDSQTRQTTSAKRWIQEHGNGEYVLSDEVFIDAGKSAFKGKNIAKDEFGRAKGELQRFIQLVEDGKIKRDSILLIDDFSRFSRLEPFKSLKLFTDVIESGIGLVFTGSYEKRIINADLINKEGNVLQFIIGELIRSYMESAERGRKIKAAKQSLFTNIKNGVVQRNNLPKYFTFVPNPGQKSIGKYIHNDRTPIVNELVKMFLAGKSLYAIADSLNERKVKTFKGYSWSGNGVNKILRNRLLIGEYKGVKNFVPKIIDADEFNKVQNILNQNKFNRGQKGTIINIFRGVCFCADPNCGKSMTVAAQYKINGVTLKTPYRYLKCSAQGKHCGCKNRGSFRLADMEDEFFTEFLFKNPSQLINDGDSKELNELNKAISTAQTRLNKLNSEIKVLVTLDAAVKGVDELKEQLTKLNKQRDTVKGELDNLNSQKLNVQDSPHDFTDLKGLLLSAKQEKKPNETFADLVAEAKTISKHLTNYLLEVRKSLQDEFVREGVRVMLPSLIGKITIDTNKGQFFVFNRMGKMVYESFVYESNRNNTEKWLSSLKRAKKTS
jgi:hypothetical protein